MIAVRPTFSESWFRVAGLKARLRATAQISRQFYRGERWYVVRDPAGNQYHRLSDAAYRFVGLLDGTRTVEQAWEIAGGALADDAPTQPEVIQILSHLYSANLVEADVTPDATVLLRRHKKQQQQKLQGRLMNVLFPRIPVWDPDRTLKQWMPVVRHLFSKIGAIVWLVVLLAALATLTPKWTELKHGAEDAISPGNWMWLWAVFVLIKFIHECGHAFACRRFGGECHEMGVMFLVFIPTPYVDASSAWSFPNKWHRMFVGAAGMIVELFFASLMAFVWVNTAPAMLVHQLAYNAMLVASVTTVIFNANPLLRYDGYYILSDWLEIPNLRQKSSDYTLGLIKRHLFDVKLQQPLPPVAQRFWLFFYGVASTIYRTFVGIVIILVVAWKVPILGVLMAIGGVVTWAVVPVFKLVKYLALDPELHRNRGRAWAFTGAAAVATVLVVGVWQFWVTVDEEGIVRPGQLVTLAPGVAGTVRQLVARDGQWVHAGDVIYRAANPEVDEQVRYWDAKVREIEARSQQALATDPNEYQADQDALIAVHKQRDKARADLAKLTLRAPIDGRLIAPKLDELVGRYVPLGTDVGAVARTNTLEVRVAMQQKDFEVVTHTPGPIPVEARLAGDVGTVLQGTNLLLLNSVQPEVPHPSLTYAGGEDIAIDPHDQTGAKPLTPQFEARVMLDNADQQWLPGQRATVRFKLEKRPLLWQWTRRFWQLVHTHETDTWI